MVLLRGGRIQTADAKIGDDAISRDQFFFPLALDVDVGVVEPPTTEVKIFFYAVPFFRIELTTRKNVEGGACCKGYVRDNETGMMCWEVVVDCGGKDPVAVVKKEDQK